MASNYRIVEVPSIYGSMYRVEEQFLYLFWFDRRTCSTLEDAIAEIEESKRQDNLPRERVVYNDKYDSKESRPEVPPIGPPKPPPMRRG